MIHCPHLHHDNSCEVAGQIAGCKVRTTPSACNACQTNENPRAINVVTIGMALVNKKRRKQSVKELESLLRNYLPERDEPDTIKIDHFRPGPGNELKRMLAWFAKPIETCNCAGPVDTMNDWGAEGCGRNIDTIFGSLKGEIGSVKKRTDFKLHSSNFKLPDAAIRKYEQKFP